jgi:glucitol/sorbitol PTS system EIIA component
MSKYEATVVGIGDMADAFAAEGMLVFFGANAPEELLEFCIVVERSSYEAPVVAGDLIEVDGATFPVLCVGEVANQNLANLDHLVVKFNGLTEPELPGDVCVVAQPAPTVEIGSVVRIKEE